MILKHATLGVMLTLYQWRDLFEVDARYLSFILITILLISAALWIQAPVLFFLKQHQISAMNYRQELIPVGLGFIIWLAVIMELALSSLWETFGLPIFSQWEKLQSFEYGLLVTLIFFAGWLDDTLGSHDYKGLTGHFKALMKHGILTTGMIKVGVTSVVSLWAVMQHGAVVWQSFVQLGVILLSTNAMNLFDLRPGRALKVFFLLSMMILLVSVFRAFPYLFPMLVGAVTVFVPDVRARAMLGDMGANLLGFAIGYTAAAFLPLWLLMIWLLMLMLLHWIAERSSITLIIENNRTLSWLDGLGRPR